MTAQPVTVKKRLGFGVGDFGLNLFWNMTNMFVLFYYTDVLGLPNTTAGTIVMGAMIWDGITDPLIGYFASKTRSRYGRYRPFILAGSVPLALSFALMFYKPDLEAAWLVAYVAASHILFRTFYTVVSIPYGSLTARITRDADERGRLAVYRMLFAASAGILVAGLTLGLADALGGGDQQTGFFRVAGIYAVFAALAVIACFFLTSEEGHDDGEKEEKPGFRDILRMLAANRAFLLVLAIVVIGNSGGTIYSKALLYYIKYNLNAEHLIGLMSAGLAIVVAAALPFWGWLSRRKSKQFVWLCGMVISVMTGIMIFLNPFEVPGVVLPLVMFGAGGASAHYFSLWACLPDTVEYGEWKTGIRAESVLFGLVSFGQKVSLGVAVGILGVMLDMIGYRANEVQSAETLDGIHFILTVLPMGFAFTCLVLVWRYPLTQKMHARISAEIAARKAEQTASPSTPGA